MCSHKNESKKRLLNLDKLLKIGVDISQDMTTDVVYTRGGSRPYQLFYSLSN